MPQDSLDDRQERRKRAKFTCSSKDPDAVKCRLFISGIQTERCNRAEIMALFTPFGKVYDVAIYNNYMFVQYDNLESSLSAIGKLHNTPYKGGALLVKLAEKGRKAEKAENELCRFFVQGNCARGENCNFKHAMPPFMENKSGHGMSNGGSGSRGPDSRDSRSGGGRPDRPGPPGRMPNSSGRPRDEGPSNLPLPNRSSGGPRDSRGSDRERMNEGRGGGILPIPTDRPSKRPHNADHEEHSKRIRPTESSSSGGTPDRMSSRMHDRDMHDRDRRSGGGQLLPTPQSEISTQSVGRNMPSGESRRPILEAPRQAALEPKLMPRDMPAAGRREAPPVDLRPPYDCVIIAGNDAQRSYCKAIEKRLSEFGMLTNVQVVGGEHLLKRAVEEAARHTVPYTICVTANNEEHRSLTLNILHGVAQEHRNMPLEDAMPFLSRNFDKFVEMMKQKISSINEWAPPDAKIACLLNLLAEGRRITLHELIEVDKYIQLIMGKLKATEAVVAAKGSRITGLADDFGGMNRSSLAKDVEPSERHHLLLQRDRELSERDRGMGDRGLLDRDRAMGDRGLIDRDRGMGGHGLLDRDRALLNRERGLLDGGILDRGLLERDIGMINRARSAQDREGGDRGGIGLMSMDRLVPGGGLPGRSHQQHASANTKRDTSYNRGYGGHGQMRGEDRFSVKNESDFGSPNAEINLQNPMVKRALDDLLTSRRKFF